MQICTVPTVLTARRRLAAALNAEGADGLSNANTVETSIPAAFVEARAQPQRCSTVQHRIRGALNAAGFESAVRKFSSGECKGATVFSRVQREPGLAPPTLAKRGERHGGASPNYGAPRRAVQRNIMRAEYGV
jgi:hypothetical protein